MHRFPQDLGRRQKWLDAFKLNEGDIKSHTRVCCMHFPNGDPQNTPQLNIGKKFASPLKRAAPRTIRARKSAELKRRALVNLSSPSSSASFAMSPQATLSKSPSSPDSGTSPCHAALTKLSSATGTSMSTEQPLSTSDGEQLHLYANETNASDSSVSDAIYASVGRALEAYGIRHVCVCLYVFRARFSAMAKN